MQSLLYFIFSLLLSYTVKSQTIEKTVFDDKDKDHGYYLAIPPRSGNIKGTLVLCNSFSIPENMLTETKLQNVAYANDLLTIAVSMKEKLYADAATIERLNQVIRHVVTKYKADTSRFVFAGYDFAGNIALRYTELTIENPAAYPVQPKAVMAVDSPVDLFGLVKWSDRQVKRASRSAGDAKYIMDIMNRETGSVTNNKSRYDQLTPFDESNSETGNEKYLVNIPVRLYYDADIEWHLKTRGNSLYDTNIPGGSELISRLLSLGNKDAELVTAKRPGMNSRGIRTTYSLSIVDEVDAIHWIKNKLEIFDPHTWIPPYQLPAPQGWEVEQFEIPMQFAPSISYKGVEDVRFAPGWGNEKSEDYWSYAYLWWLEGTQQINAAVLQQHLKAYYEGLVQQNVISRSIPANKLVLTVVAIKPQGKKGDQTGIFEGSIQTLDYMTQKPITFYVRVQSRYCPAKNHTAVFIEISPKPYVHQIWNELDKLAAGFECINNR
jgi:hypothetical protein